MRVLMVGGGCRGLGLARELVAEGHAVRAVTRRPEAVPRIEAAGAEAWVGDPGVVGTLRYALDNVTLLLWLLGTARGRPEDVAVLHGPRLRMMLERTVDTTVRGVVYEVAGTVDPGALAVGAGEVRRAQERDEIPFRLLDVDPADEPAWRRAARGAVDALLGAR
jgi:uncharacterized protein YbjT (DUF2867 family)